MRNDLDDTKMYEDVGIAIGHFRISCPNVVSGRHF